MMPLKARIAEDMKTALKARETVRLSAIRMLHSEIRKKEVDERVTLDEPAIITVIERMIKQRKESLRQFEAAGRADLAEVERTEITVLCAYLPERMGEAEIDAAIAAAIRASGATSARDMGKLMAILKPQLAGKADMALVSQRVKAQLG